MHGLLLVCLTAEIAPEVMRWLVALSVHLVVVLLLE
jgi:hypothetical protein